VYRCSILAVGDELLDGRVVDSNSEYITEKLSSLGIEVFVRIMVGDSRDDLSRALSWVIGVSDVVVVTGGLGPTDDDLTREAVADVLELSLERNADIEQEIAALFEKLGRNMPSNNLKQADVIKGAIPLVARLGREYPERCAT
jgi:nicotinamide-nucleotide amidase